MQFEDFDCESIKCNCQLLQTVQNLVNKYRSLISTESSSQIGDHCENLSSHTSTVCDPVDSSALLKAPPSPEFALSEVSSRLSVHHNCHQQSRSSLTAANSSGSSNGIRGDCRSVDENYREELNLPCHSPAQLIHSPVRIVRIPNRMCPVHSRIDQYYLNGTGSALELNYDTISVTNCWQGVKFSSPSNNASACGSCSSMKMGPSASSASNSLFFSNARISFGKFFKPFWSFVSWTLIVMVCGSIVFFLSREFE
ncbi:hypothetical protein V9T40_013046 [Parthenolecanium corni]|uniref:Uncharacterized protein n=1 Tax=Parthenolecanium corni TaxID=536013 RepID=A0AAN9TAM4_9HEMI